VRGGGLVTAPKIPTFYRGGSRFYVHPASGAKVPGVTSVLNMLPKPFLKAWAAKVVAESAVAMAEDGTLAPMVARDPSGTIDYLKRAPGRSTQGSADVGTAAHGIFEALSKGETLGRLTPELQVYADHFRDYLDTIQPEYHRLEDTVWSETHGYAGSFDAYATIQGEKVWLDNKTTKSGVHAEVALQLSAYAHADYLLDGETGETLLQPQGTRGGIVHVRPEGWAFYEVPIGEDVFEHFLNLRKVFTWDTEASKGVVGRPVAKGSGVKS
jgi:hypothetical protein